MKEWFVFLLFFVSYFHSFILFFFKKKKLDSYIYARDHFLKPGGTLFPSAGKIHLSPFTDSKLWKETNTNADFWKQDSFLGINLSVLHTDACHELFSELFNVTSWQTIN